MDRAAAQTLFTCSCIRAHRAVGCNFRLLTHQTEKRIKKADMWSVLSRKEQRLLGSVDFVGRFVFDLGIGCR